MPQPLRKSVDRWIPWMFVGCFVIVIAVNVFMMTVAIKTNGGTVTDHAYENGLAYNQTLAASDKQKALGWTSQIELKNHRLTLHLTDKTGQPVTQAKVKLTWMREVQSGYDRTTSLTETDKGLYTADVSLPLPGQWDTYVEVLRGSDTYRTKKTIINNP